MLAELSKGKEKLSQKDYDKLKPLIDAEPRYAMWFRDNRSTDLVRAQSPHGAVYATPSRYARTLWKMWADKMKIVSKMNGKDTMTDTFYDQIEGEWVETGTMHYTRK